MPRWMMFSSLPSGQCPPYCSLDVIDGKLWLITWPVQLQSNGASVFFPYQVQDPGACPEEAA